MFCGDLIMGWSTSLVSPPDGDMGAFMASTARLANRSDRIFYPGHGGPITDPAARCSELIAHRRTREAQILGRLSDFGPATALTLARHIYTDLAPALLPAATRNVLAHLIDLHAQTLVSAQSALHSDTKFQTNCKIPVSPTGRPKRPLL